MSASAAVTYARPIDTSRPMSAMARRHEMLSSSPSLVRTVRRGGFVASTLLAATAFGLAVPHHPLAAALGLVLSLAGALGLFCGRPGAVTGPPWFAGRRSAWALLPAAVTLAGAVLVNDSSRGPDWFALLVATFWLLLMAGPVVGTLVGGASILTFAGEWIWVYDDPGWSAWIGGTVFTVVAGLLLERELQLVGQLRAAQADLAERSRAEERSRIAYELHDVIAHSLTISLLHLSSARVALEYEPEDAARSLAEAERVGRRTLDEIRATIGFIGEPSGLRAPIPGLADLPALIDDLRLAGADIALAFESDSLAGVPETVGTTAYRIVQEALTNASKHAPGAAVRAVVARASNNLDVTVDSSGPPGQGRGMGLASMQERARAVGGTCTAGPADQGWQVHASLPLGGRIAGALS